MKGSFLFAGELDRSISRRYVIGLCLVILTAASIRYNNVQNRGLWYWDEGLFIMGARFLRWQASRWFLLLGQYFDAGLTVPGADSYAGYPVFLQKPVHVVSLAVFSCFQKFNIASAINYSILSSLMTIFLTAELGRRWFSPYSGLLAALWLAFQPSHVHYSRLALHEMDSMAIFLLMLVGRSMLQQRLHSALRQRIIGMCVGGLAVMSVGASYRYLPYVLIFFAFEAGMPTGKQVPPGSKRALWTSMILGALIAFLMINMSYLLAFYPDFLWSEPSSYLSVLRTKFLSEESSFDLQHPFFYLKMFVMFDGMLPTVIWLVALCCIFWERSRPGLALVVWITVPLILFSITTTRVPRTVTGIYPFIAITWGYFMVQTWNRLRDNPRTGRFFWLIPVLILLITGSMFCRLPAIWTLKSGYPDVVQWLQKQPGQQHLSTMYPVYAVYQGREFVGPVPFSLEDIHREVERTKIRYLTVDWQKFLRYSRGVYEIEKEILPIYAVRHNPGIFFASLYENHLPSDVPNLRQDSTLQYIKVYDLYDALPRLGYPLSFLEITNE